MTFISAEKAKYPNPYSWENWALNPDLQCLEYFAGNSYWPMYQIDLEQCRTPAQVLDWICQVSRKTWATNPCVAGLVQAFNDVLEPQATLCSGGVGRNLLMEDIRNLVKHASEQDGVPISPGRGE